MSNSNLEAFGAATIIMLILGAILGVVIWGVSGPKVKEFEVRCEYANGTVLAGKCIPKDTKFIEIKLGGEK